MDVFEQRVGEGIEIFAQMLSLQAEAVEEGYEVVDCMSILESTEEGKKVVDVAIELCSGDLFYGLFENILDMEDGFAISEREKLLLMKYFGQVTSSHVVIERSFSRYADYMESLIEDPKFDHKKDYYQVIADSARKVSEDDRVKHLAELYDIFAQEHPELDSKVQEFYEYNNKLIKQIFFNELDK